MIKRPERTASGVAKRFGLLALIATVLVALLGFLAPTASASPTFHPQTRVAAIEQPTGQLVAPHSLVLAVQGRERAPNYDRSATGSSVAAEEGTGATVGPGGGIGPGAASVNDPAYLSRGPWELTQDGASAVVRGGPFNSPFYESASDGTWWTRDLAGHGGSAFKVYESTSTGLQWITDADQCGDYITGKWKGGTGYFIPWSQLAGR